MEKRNEIYARWYLQRRSLFRVQSIPALVANVTVQ